MHSFAARGGMEPFGLRRRINSTPETSPVVKRPSVAGVSRENNSSGCGYGSGRSTAAFTVLKMAVVAPMPTASVRIAAKAKPGCRRIERKLNRRSVSMARASASHS